MRIAFSNAGLDWRGTETDTMVLAKGLRERGHDVVVFCRPNSAIQQRTDFPVEPILSGRDFDPLAIMRCRGALRRRNVQIVVTQKDKDLRLTGIAAWSMGVPVLVRHVTDRPLKHGLRYRFLFGRVASHHLANSEATRATLLRSAPWLSAEVPVIHNGIDVQAYADAAAADLDLPEGAIAVGFVGAFEMRKGIVDFAQAWQRIAETIPDAHAIIVGAGPREADFRAAMWNAPRVHWLGFRNDLPNVLKALDVFVMPSRFEGFGLVLAEAMAAGVAAVAYDASSLPELARNGVTGILVEPENVAELAAAVIALCRDEEIRHRMARAAQARARLHFTAERMVEQHEQLIKRIVVSSVL